MSKTLSKLFRFRPTASTPVVIISVFIMWFLYYGGSNIKGIAAEALFIGGVMLGLSTIFVAWYVHKYERGILSDLGIHTKRLKTALGVSAFFGLGSIPYYFQLADTQGLSVADALPHLAWSLLMLWEVLFVFGWLQIRLDRAFGAIPAICITPLAFMLYHIGSIPGEQFVGLLAAGLAGAVIFRLVKMNIFVLWPFAWCVASAIGTLSSSNLVRSWSNVALMAFVVVMQLVILNRVLRNKQ